MTKKLYTLDNALLTNCPEIRVGSKVYPIDDRTSTVKKIMQVNALEERDQLDKVDDVFVFAFGEQAAKEIQELDLRFSAQMELYTMVMAIIVGEEPETVKKRFQNRTEEK